MVPTLYHVSFETLLAQRKSEKLDRVVEVYLRVGCKVCLSLAPPCRRDGALDLRGTDTRPTPGNSPRPSRTLLRSTRAPPSRGSRYSRRHKNNLGFRKVEDVRRTVKTEGAILIKHETSNLPYRTNSLSRRVPTFNDRNSKIF